jgi:dihydrofolate synthase/folylpolyglutamate synthase
VIYQGAEAPQQKKSLSVQYLMMRFSSSAEVFHWIESFINHERGTAAVRDFRLERMEILSGLAGHPERSAPVVHVAGSKGKGSVTGMIAAILEAGGIRTARYASPHVNDFRERISGGRGFFSEEVYAEAGEELATATDALEKLPSPEFLRFSGGWEGNASPTFFELMTLWFFLCARRNKCGAMAVETGMGGRLDATNIVDPSVSIITLIEKEHTEYLGDTLAAIAGEKAGIIKRRRPLVLAKQNREALEVFREKAGRAESPLIYFPEHAELRNIRIKREGTSFTLFLKKSEALELFVPIPGTVQAQNAALAALAIKTTFPAIQENAISEGLGRFTHPPRV